VLDLLSGPLAVALHATLVSRDLQHSRERLVTAREEERRRLRRDLHDGLGPLLTGVALAADAAANLAEREPEQARELLSGVRADTRIAIGEVRRVVEDLRPPALAELGLAGALKARAAQTVRRADGNPLHVTVEATYGAELPAAIEVAAYRIATEALNNAVRHAAANAVQLRLRVDDELVVEVTDDGRSAEQWRPGVGLTAMRERAAELGGACEAGPSPEGGIVRARLPLAFA
jgi:signal transduction histidine kinase